MPLEIKELVIRATIDAGAKAGGSEAGGEAGKGGGKGDGGDRAALVTECVEQVMEILRRERER